MATNRAEESGGHEAAADGQVNLFKGMSFWLSKTVPQKSRFEELIQQYGGVVRLQEKDADVLLVDHTRKNLTPDVYSYKFIEKSIQDGVLQDLEKYKAGPSSARPVGATNIPTKGHRTPYTLEDDQILWDYMQPFEEDPTAPVSGNKLYQDLAAKYPQHTYQSWRDRYRRKLQGHPRPGGLAEPKETPREARSRASTRPDETVNRRNEILQQTREKKRKLSPKPSIATGRISSDRFGAQQTNPTKGHSSQVQIPSETYVPRELSGRETPSSHKKMKTTVQPGSEDAIPLESTKTDDAVISDLFLELPFFEATPESEGEEPKQDVDTWIEDRLSRGKGNESQIIHALQCTSMDPKLADMVLDSMIAGKGIPTSVRGVWTAQDDICVNAQDSREIQSVFDKHGSDLFNARWEYLNM
ncbi:TRF2-interacting telomeric protein/Rap1 C terminal domain-containing protein [Aspergillus heterothallicus]